MVLYTNMFMGLNSTPTRTITTNIIWGFKRKGTNIKCIESKPLIFFFSFQEDNQNIENENLMLLDVQVCPDFSNNFLFVLFSFSFFFYLIHLFSFIGRTIPHNGIGKREWDTWKWLCFEDKNKFMGMCDFFKSWTRGDD